MRIEWLYKKSSDRVVLFFNGWGMDEQAVNHLKGDIDVVVCWDYRDLMTSTLPSLANYREIYVIAWSMGVWAAANLLPRLNIEPEKLIGLNGTEHPVDDKSGIPERIYLLTERGMNEQGRIKFIQRMLDTESFNPLLTKRPLDEVCEELCLIRKQSTGQRNELKWNKIFISEKDVIFPVANQRNWWEGRASEVQILPGGHYPFGQFKSWEAIIGG